LGKPDELKRRIPSGFSVEIFVTRLTDDIVEGIQRLENVEKLTTTDYEGEAEGEKVDRLVIRVGSDKTVPEVLNYMSNKPCRIISVNLRGPTLEDLFMFYTGGK